MARKIHTFKYTSAELDEILRRSDEEPFVVWHDENAGVYRFFPDEERMNIWIDAYNNDDMTPEIEAYQFIDPITAPAPYTMNINVLNDNLPILYGTVGNVVNFTFETLDGDNRPVSESVDVYYTFRSQLGTKTTSAVYNAGTVVSMNIDKYISIGRNTVSITIKGRTTGVIKTVVATYQVVELSLESSFNFAQPRNPNVPFEVEYLVKGDGDRIVEFYIDGHLIANPTIAITEGNVVKRQQLVERTPGKHSLQMVAKMQIGNYLFKSKLLYYEFVIVGVDLTTTLISEEFSSNTDVFIDDTKPGIQGEQYVIKEINWGYYSSDPNKYSAVIEWRLFNPGGDNIPIATRTADVVEADSGELPEPLRFMPTEEGSYHLQALIDGVVINVPDYTISIIKNTSGVVESTNGLTMKLSGLGRSNTEPSSTINSWESFINDIRYRTTFYNQPWNDNSGWINNALVLNGGPTALIDIKHFAEEASPTTRSGSVFEIDFETFNVLDEDAELLRIGGLGTACLVITATKAMLKGSIGTTIISRFKADERIKIAFVIYPKDTTVYQRKIFVYNNGVMSGVVDYDVAENFDMGRRADTESTIGMINIGDANGNAGIKIYYIRTYDNYISMYEEINNYFIDSGENLNYLLADNDIYSSGKIIDVDKLESTITTVKLTGSLNEIIGTGSKDTKLTCKLEVVSPTNSNINLYCDKAQVNKAGQSTLEKPVPSFHIRLDKIKGNVCYDRDGNIYSKNRWAFREGNVPEKKFRLQANYMDSSGCHNAAFFRLVNEVYPKVKINGQDVLRIPAEKYATDIYPTAMTNIHGEDPSGNNWKFPYNINICPDSIPCIVVWRPDEDSPYRFLGQYVIMEEKKANYANGMHSIYSGLDPKGNADPYGFKYEKAGTKLWDNADCHQMEFLRSASSLDFLCDDSTWDVINPDTGKKRREDSFELIYPDEDDLNPTELENEWDKFYNDVVSPIVDSYNNGTPLTSDFNDLFYGEHPRLDRWGFAAYYCLVLRHACSDSLVRNMELVTYDGVIWTPKFWDVDMQCGLQQSGECNIQPTSDRDTKISQNIYALSGRIVEGGVLKSSWLWDGLTGNTELNIDPNENFMEDVRAMDAALFEAGWRYSKITKIQDEEYVNTWSKALYNESGVIKYLTYGNDSLNFKSLQGDRTPHRHWFLRTSFDYFDALNVCGEYTSKVCKAKMAAVSSPNNHIYIVPSATSYFGLRYTNTIIQSGLKIEKGEEGYLTLSSSLTLQEFAAVMGANKIAEIDFSELATNLYSELDFSDSYDEVLGTQFIKIVLGAKTIQSLNTGKFNTNSGISSIGGISLLSKLEHLNIRGFQYITSLNLLELHRLKKFYAAGSGLFAFNPASGSNFEDVELPTTITSITMNGCNLTNSDDECLIKWYNTIYTSNVPTSVEEVTVPSTILSMSFTAMGNDVGTKELIFDWLNAVESANGNFNALTLTCTNVNWTDVDIEDLMLLFKIPAENNRRNVTGYIRCSETITSENILAIIEALGYNPFTNNTGVRLRIDASEGFVIGAPEEVLAGNTINITGVAFPISAGITANYKLGTYVDGQFVSQTQHTDLQGRKYYQLNETILYEDGTLITQETSRADYNVVVQGYTSQVADYAEITIKKRVYPSSINCNITHTSNKKVIYNNLDENYYVADNDLTLSFAITLSPENITGTIVSEVWTISNSISSLVSIVNQTNNFLELYVSEAGNTLSQGTVTHTKTYVDGTVVSKVVNLKFKSAVVGLNSVTNSELQKAVYDAGYSENQYSTTDIELATIADLTFALGNGVDESEDTFIIKPSKRILPMPTGLSSIDGIKGNSIVWNQYCKPFVTGNYLEDGVKCYTSNGILNFGTNTNTYYRGTIYTPFKTLANHKYLWQFDVINFNVFTALRFCLGDNISYEKFGYDVNSTGRKSVFLNSTNDETIDECGYRNAAGQSSENALFSVGNMVVFDLTLIFGAGNEPTTVAEFESWLATNVGLRDYYPYNAGEIINCKVQGIKSVGFNQWDEEWELGSIDSTTGEKIPNTTSIRSKNDILVFPNTTYYYCQLGGSGSARIAFLDAEHNTISVVVTGIFNSTFTTPAKCSFIRFSTHATQYGSTYNHDICINLSWSGDKNGTYEPYWTETKEFDVTKIYGKLDGEGELVQVFPNGMNHLNYTTASSSIVEVYDSIIPTQAIRCSHKIDLGDLTGWSYSDGIFKCQDPFIPFGGAPYFNSGGFMCTRYSNYNGRWVSATNSNMSDKMLGMYTSGGAIEIRVKDSSIPTTATSAEIQQALSGVTLICINGYTTNYVNYTDLIYRDNGVDTPFSLPINYKVDDWGTEEQVMPTPSTNEITSCAAALDIQHGASIIRHLAELNSFINLDMNVLNLSAAYKLGSISTQVDLEDNTSDYVDVLPRKTQNLNFDFEEIDASNTQLKGVNPKQGNVLETITYGDYTEEVVLVNQSALTEVNIPDDAPLDKLIIENCNELEEITWI